jgi:hypothetical protein
VRDHRGDAASPRRGAIGLAGIAFVAQCGAWGDVRPYVEQGLESGCVRNLAAGQIERNDVARIVRLGVDFGREPATRAAERLALLPPFAPAAEIWARTMVESNIWIKWADALISASVSKKASNTPALLSRSKRFHTEFQWPKRSGSARQRTFSTVKKCIASRNNRSSTALRPRRGRQALKTSSAFAQSVSVIFVDIADLQINRQPMNQTGFVPGTPNPIPESIRPHRLVSSFISDARSLPENVPVSFDILGFSVTDYTVDAATKAVIVPVKAKELVSLPGISDQSIFAYNVRGPLGKTQVNRDIVKSIKNVEKHKFFPLFHNGITIIASEVAYDTERLNVSGYYVVNGCQSLTALFDHKEELTDDLRVLAKFIKLDTASSEAEDITKFSNNQNGVKARDFKANNPIQIRLQNEFSTHYGGDLAYEIKRGETLPDVQIVTNESAGLLLMAFDLKEPWGTHRRYQIFDEKFAALFGRPEVNADRIVFCKTIADSVEDNLNRIENELCRKYVLTRHMLLYIVRLVLDAEAPQLATEPAKYVRSPENRKKFKGLT